MWILITNDRMYGISKTLFPLAYRGHLDRMGQIEPRKLGVWIQDLSKAERMYCANKGPRAFFDANVFLGVSSVP